MQTIFCRRANLASLLLRSVTWSSWSHCAIVTPEGTVIEAAALHGVIERPRAAFMAGVSKFSEKTIELPDDAAAIAWARAQIGKPYDWLGAFGLALHREWDNPDRWWCSELVEGAAVAGRRPRFVSNAGRVTPQHSWMVA